MIIIGILCFLCLTIIYYLITIKHKRKVKGNKSKISKYRCLDGHLVRSKGELIIDNYLFFLGISHIYEKVIYLRGNKVKCDWYLPEYDIYIEYWGYSGKKYFKRKKEKLRSYRKEKKKLISIENWMFYDVYTNINKLLKKYTKKHVRNNLKILSTKKFCSNCGAELDERF